jgi:hypothetical protein
MVTHEVLCLPLLVLSEHPLRDALDRLLDRVLVLAVVHAPLAQRSRRGVEVPGAQHWFVTGVSSDNMSIVLKTKESMQ